MKKNKQIKNSILLEADTANLLQRIRFFFIKLLSGKYSILVNCKLTNSDIIVRGNCLVLKNLFVYGKNVEKRLEGITIKPRK